MDPPQKAVDETTESINPLDQSASSPSNSTTNEYASTEANDRKCLGKCTKLQEIVQLVSTRDKTDYAIDESGGL